VSAIDDLAGELSKLPGIGRKTALRLTYYLLKQRPEQSRRLADALTTLAERVRPCAECYNLTEEERCAVCRDQRRDHGRDLRGRGGLGHRRHRAHRASTGASTTCSAGRLSPLDGVMPRT
jgi:recombination protein RecR